MGTGQVAETPFLVSLVLFCEVGELCKICEFCEIHHRCWGTSYAICLSGSEQNCIVYSLFCIFFIIIIIISFVVILNCLCL